MSIDPLSHAEEEEVIAGWNAINAVWSSSTSDNRRLEEWELSQQGELAISQRSGDAFPKLCFGP